jgi:hypothetical protein
MNIQLMSKQQKIFSNLPHDNMHVHAACYMYAMLRLTTKTSQLCSLVYCVVSSVSVLAPKVSNPEGQQP